MIKIKISDLLNSTEALQKLSQTQLKARLALQVGRLLKEGERELQNFNTIRMNLVNKYGEKDENGELITNEEGNCKIDAKESESFNAEFSDVINTEIEINANKLKLDDFDNLDFTPSDMILLEPFIETEE